jgi:hypothetical protein
MEVRQARLLSRADDRNRFGTSFAASRMTSSPWRGSICRRRAPEIPSVGSGWTEETLLGADEADFHCSIPASGPSRAFAAVSETGLPNGLIDRGAERSSGDPMKRSVFDEGIVQRTIALKITGFPWLAAHMSSCPGWPTMSASAPAALRVAASLARLPQGRQRGASAPICARPSDVRMDELHVMPAARSDEITCSFRGSSHVPKWPPACL